MPNVSQLAEIIADEFYCNRFDLSARQSALATAWEFMPEVEGVRQLRSLGAAGRSIRTFVTLVSAMERARDSNQLWRAGVELFKINPELFDPRKIISIPSEMLSAGLRENKVSRYHKQDIAAWRAIANSLTTEIGPVCRLIDSGVGIADELLKDLRSRDREGHCRYPLLRGPKIGPMWVRIMANPGGAKIEGIDTIPIAVDVQVRRATRYLGVSLKLNETKRVIQSVWRKAVLSGKIGGPSGISGTCAALDPALWFFGKYGCSHCEKIGRQAPISRACNYCRLPVSSSHQMDQ